MDLDALQRRIVAVETFLIVLTIASIATADALVGDRFSLGPLYLIPISYSALTHRLRTTVALVVVCVVLRQLLGPLGNSVDPWLAVLRDLAIAGVFVVAVVVLRRLGIERRRIFDLAREQRDELAREVELAAVVQERLLELSEPPASEVDIAARSEPLRGVGGDFYDFIDHGDNRCGIVIADIAGKGVPAALLMPALRFGFRSVVAGRRALARRIGQLNEEFFATTDPRHYGTLFYARFNLETGRITYVNAGHTPPILVEADGEWRSLDAGGPPIGLLGECTYESERIDLEPGSTMLLYTDGVTEAADPDDNELGIERLAELVAANPTATAEELIDAVFERVHAHLDGREPGDDSTVIVIKRPS